MLDTTTFNYETTTNSPITATSVFDGMITNPNSTTGDTLADLFGVNDIQQQQHHQITFEIPTNQDLKHIDRLHHFNSLLKRIGNVAYDTIATEHQANTHKMISDVNSGIFGHGGDGGGGGGDSVGVASITHEQIAQSVVLDLADLKHHGSNNSSWEEFFGDTDMHTIINYLWIGVVTSLIVLSVIFIIFSCYFYRKFRDWKKCNKDIRAHLNNNNDLYASGNLVRCENLLTPVGSFLNEATNGSAAVAYYQMESPPCYTIATGLPTYDEALNDQQKQQHQHQHHHRHLQHHRQNYQQQEKHKQHYIFGMKFMYPKIAAVHQRQHQQQQQQMQQQQQHACQSQRYHSHHRHHSNRHQLQQQHHHAAMLGLSVFGNGGYGGVGDGVSGEACAQTHWEQDFVLKCKHSDEQPKGQQKTSSTQQQQQHQHQPQEHQQHRQQMFLLLDEGSSLIEAPPAYDNDDVAAVATTAAIILPTLPKEEQTALSAATLAATARVASSQYATPTTTPGAILMTSSSVTNEQLNAVSIHMAEQHNGQNELHIPDVQTTTQKITAAATATACDKMLVLRNRNDAGADIDDHGHVGSESTDTVIVVAA